MANEPTSRSGIIDHEQPLKGMNFLSPAHTVDPSAQFRQVVGFKFNIKNGIAYKKVPKKVIIN